MRGGYTNPASHLLGDTLARFVGLETVVLDGVFNKLRTNDLDVAGPPVTAQRPHHLGRIIITWAPSPLLDWACAVGTPGEVPLELFGLAVPVRLPWTLATPSTFQHLRSLRVARFWPLSKAAYDLKLMLRLEVLIADSWSSDAGGAVGAAATFARLPALVTLRLGVLNPADVPGKPHVQPRQELVAGVRVLAHLINVSLCRETWHDDEAAQLGGATAATVEWL
jgi:hypothetical protein